MSDHESLLTKETTPLWFNVRKSIDFDESTARLRLLQNTSNSANLVSALNIASELRFDYTPTPDQIILMSDKNTCLRLRCTFYTANTTNGNWQGTTAPITGVNGVSLNPNADVTLESAFFGHLFDRAQLLVGSATTPMDAILYLPPWFQLMNHIQPIDFRIANGEALGYIPDEVSGRAIGNVNPYILLVNINGAVIATNANGAFGIFATVSITVAVAANGIVTWTIPGTNYTLQLISSVALAAPVAPATSATYTGIFQLAAPFAVAANTTMPFCFGGGILILNNATAAAIAAGAAINIVCQNTTGSQLTAETVGFGVGNVSKYPASTSIMQYPINVQGVNQNFEPGYMQRQRIYNTIPVGGDGGRQFELMIPLYYLFGFCNWFNRLMSNVSFTVLLQRSVSTNPFIGLPGTDGFIMINEIYLQILQVVPSDNFKVEYNRAIERPIPIGFMTPHVQLDSITGTQINVLFKTAIYKPNFVFVMFKDAYQANQTVVNGQIIPQPLQSSQINGTLNTNADIKDLQIFLGGEAYPTQIQDAHWGIGTDYRSVGMNRFYEQFKDCCIKMSGECSLGFKQFRDLYPIFAFDLTAQTTKIHNTNVQFSVIGTRNSQTPTNVNMYTIVVFEKYFEAHYLSNTITPKSVQPDMTALLQQFAMLKAQLEQITGVAGAGMYLN